MPKRSRRFTDNARAEVTALEVTHELSEVRGRVTGDTSGFVYRLYLGGKYLKPETSPQTANAVTPLAPTAPKVEASQVVKAAEVPARWRPRRSARLLLVYRGGISAVEGGAERGIRLQRWVGEKPHIPGRFPPAPPATPSRPRSRTTLRSSRTTIYWRFSGRRTTRPRRTARATILARNIDR